MNSADLKENYDFSQFNTHYNPIFVIDASKILLYKNDISKILGTFRLGTNIEKYIVHSDIPIMERCIAEKNSSILTLNSTLKGSKILFTPLPDETNLFVIAVILSSHLICNMPSGYQTKFHHELFYNNVQTLKKFEDCLFKMADCSDNTEKYKKLLLRNTQLMSRMERHFNLYVNKYQKISGGESKEEERIVNISHFMKDIYDLSLVPCSSLGYRIFLVCDNDYILVKLNRFDFICEFLSIITLILRISDNMKLNIHLYENEHHAVFAFSFDCENYSNKLCCLEGELEFITGAANILGWKWERKTDVTNPSAHTLYVSISKNTCSELLVKSPNDDYDFRGGIQYYSDIIHSELSVLYEEADVLSTNSFQQF